MNTNRRKRILPGGWLRLLNVILVIALILGLCRCLASRPHRAGRPTLQAIAVVGS